MRPQEKVNLLKTGVFVTVLLFILGVFVFTLGAEQSIFESKLHVKFKTKNAENLKLGAMVHLKGLKIGSVESIKFITVSEMEITLVVLEEHAKWIKTDSIITFKTAGVLGDKYVEISGGTDQAESVKDYAYIEQEKSVDMKDLLTKGGNIMTTSEQLMTKLNDLLVNVDSKSLGHTIKNLESSTQNLNRVLAEIDAKKINQSMTNLANVTERIQKGPGTLHSLIYDDSAHEDLKVLLGGAQRSSVLKFFIRESIKKAEEANKK